MRVEPGEIEAALFECPDLRDAAVLAREDEHNDRRIVAYVVSKNREAPTTTELRRFLSARLPEYMIPSAFVEVDALPRLPSGKLDRYALHMSTNPRPNLNRPFVPPRSLVEWRLTKIWQTVLAAAVIGVTDNFFDLGGNSLDALLLLSYIDRTFTRKLPIAMLYQAPTVEELAAVLEDEKVSAPW